MKSSDIVIALEKRFSDSRQYAVATEVSNGTGSQITRRLDVVVVNCYESHGQCIEGIEIKVSKADLRYELRNPEKHECFYPDLDFFSLATTKEALEGLFDELPKKWGVYVVDGNGKVRSRRNALALHEEKRPTVSRAFNASILRAMAGRSDGDAYIHKIRQEAIQEGRTLERLNNNYAREVDHLKSELKKYEIFSKNCGHIGGDAEEIKRIAETYKAISTWGGQLTGISQLQNAKRSIDEAIEALDKLSQEKKEALND